MFSKKKRKKKKSKDTISVYNTYAKLRAKSSYGAKLAYRPFKLAWFTHGFKNRYGGRTGKIANYRFYGRTGVRPMVEPMTS